jgi:hypothetical protein
MNSAWPGPSVAPGSVVANGTISAATSAASSAASVAPLLGSTVSMASTVTEDVVALISWSS